MINRNPDQVSITSPHRRALNLHKKQSLSLHLNLSYNLQSLHNTSEDNLKFDHPHLQWLGFNSLPLQILQVCEKPKTCVEEIALRFFF